MYKLLLVLIIYIYIMYYNYQRIKDSEIDMIRFRDSIARFTYIQFVFGGYDSLIGKFDLTQFVYRTIFSHIGIASYSFIKEYIDKMYIV